MWARVAWPGIEHWTGAVDVVHATNFVAPPSRAPIVVTVHDLAFAHSPELCRPETLSYEPLLRQAIARGALVHAVSDFVAAEVREYFNLPEHRVVRVYAGIAPTGDGDAAAGRELAGGALRGRRSTTTSARGSSWWTQSARHSPKIPRSSGCVRPSGSTTPTRRWPRQSPSRSASGRRRTRFSDSSTASLQSTRRRRPWSIASEPTAAANATGSSTTSGEHRLRTGLTPQRALTLLLSPDQLRHLSRRSFARPASPTGGRLTLLQQTAREVLLPWVRIGCPARWRRSAGARRTWGCTVTHSMTRLAGQVGLVTGGGRGIRRRGCRRVGSGGDADRGDGTHPNAGGERRQGDRRAGAAW